MVRCCVCKKMMTNMELRMNCGCGYSWCIAHDLKKEVEPVLAKLHERS